MSYSYIWPIVVLKIQGLSSSNPVFVPEVKLYPLFVIWLGQNCQENRKTKSSQILDLTIFPFASWSPFTWAKNGQSLDLQKSNICPLFVQDQIPRWVSKQWHLGSTVFGDASGRTVFPRCHGLWTGGILENWTPKMPCLVNRGDRGNQYCQDYPCS